MTPFYFVSAGNWEVLLAGNILCSLAILCLLCFLFFWQWHALRRKGLKNWSRIDWVQEWETRGGSCSSIPPQPSLFRTVVTCILWLVAIRIKSDNPQNPSSALCNSGWYLLEVHVTKMVGAWLPVYGGLQSETLMHDIHGKAISLCVSWVYTLWQCVRVSWVAELLFYSNWPTLFVLI